jgi:hypothetical protein
VLRNERLAAEAASINEIRTNGMKVQKLIDEIDELVNWQMSRKPKDDTACTVCGAEGGFFLCQPCFDAINAKVNQMERDTQP